ncbi:MAG: transcription antitermination protein NusB [Bacteroidota bacterium]
MLTRRQIRAKVMQSIYAFKKKSSNNLIAEEKFIEKSAEDMYDLFLLNLSLLVETRNQAKRFLELSKQKHLATEADKNPNQKFINNEIIQRLQHSDQLNELLEDRKLNHWIRDDEYPKMIWDALRKHEILADYNSTRESSFQEDKQFIVDFFKVVVAPNENLYDYFEDNKLTWVDDLPIVNTSLLKFLQKQKENQFELKIPDLFKNGEDAEFGKSLFKKTMLNENEYLADISGKTPGWEKDRIADIDRILILMGMCEFAKFPSIPVKVTINEYLEIAKEYSTPKSSIFINGVLDKISKEYQENGKLNKIGRGLM